MQLLLQRSGAGMSPGSERQQREEFQLIMYLLVSRLLDFIIYTQVEIMAAVMQTSCDIYQAITKNIQSHWC